MQCFCLQEPLHQPLQKQDTYHELRSSDSHAVAHAITRQGIAAPLLAALHGHQDSTARMAV